MRLERVEEGDRENSVNEKKRLGGGRREEG